VSPPAPIAVHQQHRVVSAQEVALAALALFAVPGAGVQFPPGALDTQEDFKVEALQNAVDDNLISEADKASCIVKVRLPPNVPPPAGWE